MDGGNNVFGEAQNAASTGTVIFLGKLGSIDACRQHCLAEGDCQSFVYHSKSLHDFKIPTKPDAYRSLCYGRLDAHWSPKHQKGVYSELLPSAPQRERQTTRSVAHA